MPEAEGFESGDPASLLFIESRQDQVEPTVLVGNRPDALAAFGTGTCVNGAFDTGTSRRVPVRVCHELRKNTAYSVDGSLPPFCQLFVGNLTLQRTL